MLHGEVHGALEALDAGVDHLPGQPRERLLDVQIEVGVVQIVVPQALNHQNRSQINRLRAIRNTESIGGKEDDEGGTGSENYRIS